LKPETYSSVTLGFLIDFELENKINFINDSKIKKMDVSDTCENCNITNCDERVAKPVMVHNQEKKDNIQLSIDKLISEIK
jgi:hypothetical protein